MAFAPKPRDYAQKMPKKMKRQALFSALSSKVANNEMIVLEKFTMAEPKTKFIVKVLNNFKVDKKALIVLQGRDKVIERSARNIPGVKAIPINNLNVYEILKYDSFIITKDAIEAFEEVYAV